MGEPLEMTETTETTETTQPTQPTPLELTSKTPLEVAQERLSLYYEAERRVLVGQSYTIGDRQLTRANLAEIRKAIDSLKDEIEQLMGRSRGFSRRVVFMD